MSKNEDKVFEEQDDTPSEETLLGIIDNRPRITKHRAVANSFELAKARAEARNKIEDLKLLKDLGVDSNTPEMKKELKIKCNSRIAKTSGFTAYAQ